MYTIWQPLIWIEPSTLVVSSSFVMQKEPSAKTKSIFVHGKNLSILSLGTPVGIDLLNLLKDRVTRLGEFSPMGLETHVAVF
jgi:hypothetical protein